MAIGFIIGILLFLLIAGATAMAVYQYITASKLTNQKYSSRVNNEEDYARQKLNNLAKSKKYKFRGNILVAVCIVLFAVFITIPFSIHQVNTGEVAVVRKLGEAKYTRSAGTYFDFWITNKYDIYDSKVQNVEIVTPAYSKDAQTMDLAMTVQYQIKQDEAVDIAKHYGSLSVLESRIQSVAIEKAKSTLSSYSAMTIIETRSSVSPKVEEVIRAAVNDEYHVTIVTVVLTNIDFSNAFELTVENKMIAEQEKLKAEYEKATAIVNAEKELEVSKLQAQGKIESAKGDAQSQLEVAKAEAEATQLKSIEVARALGFKINETVITNQDETTSIKYEIDFTGKTSEEIKVITDYMKYMEYLTKWDGKLPTVTTDNGSSIIIPNP